jgi:ABC-type uncharacterized transport system permease subunit
MRYEHKNLIVLAFGITFCIASIAGFFYLLATNHDWTGYPVIGIFAGIGASLLVRAAHPPVRLEEPPQ